MAIVTTHVCDRCGHTQPAEFRVHPKPIEHRDMLAVRISVSGNPQAYFSQQDLNRDALWCLPCLNKVGIVPKRVAPGEEKPPVPTFEEMLREIVREEINDRA